MTKFTTAALTALFLWVAAALPAWAGPPHPSLADALARIRIFSDLTEPERQHLQTIAEIRQGKAGEQLIHKDRAMGRMVVVLDGQAEVSVNNQVIARLNGQILLGEIEFLDSGPASADVFLLRDSPYVVLDNSGLDALMAAHPRLGYVILREIAKIEANRLRKSSP